MAYNAAGLVVLMATQNLLIVGNNKAYGTLLLDIRAPADFKAGRVIGAKNIPFADLTKRMSELEKHKDKPIVIICKTGQTASSAANMLKKADYTNVHRMSGGMAEWTGQNLPLVRK